MKKLCFFIIAFFACGLGAEAQIISTIAGTGAQGYSGDGGQATAAELLVSAGVAVDASGNLYIGGDSRIRMVNAAGIISTIAGTGTAGYSGDGGAATAAQLDGGGLLGLG